MAIIKYDVSGVEAKSDAVPPADVYAVKLLSLADNKPANKDRRLEPVVEIVDGDHKGYKFYDYIPLTEEMEWKLAEFVRAFGLPDKGGLDPKKVIGNTASVRTVVKNSDEYGMQAKIRRWLSADDEDATGTSDEDLDDDGDGEDEDETEGTDTWTEEELNELALKELQTICDEADLDKAAIVKGKKTAAQKKEALVAAILEAQEAEDDGEIWTEEELGELDDDDLKALMVGDPDDDEDEGFGLDPDDYTKSKKNPKTKKTVKTFDRDAAIAAILEAQGEGDEDGEEEDGEEDGEEAVDYNEMELADLKALCKERGLKTQGTKKILVARLEKADEPV